MQRNYQQNQQPQNQQPQNQQPENEEPLPARREWVRRIARARDAIETDIRNSRESLARHTALVNANNQLQWDSIMALALSDSVCTICTGKGHRIFKCPSLPRVKGIKNGIEVLRPVYNRLVATEMLRIYENELAGVVDEEQPEMDQA